MGSVRIGFVLSDEGIPPFLGTGATKVTGLRLPSRCDGSDWACCWRGPAPRRAQPVVRPSGRIATRCAGMRNSSWSSVPWSSPTTGRMVSRARASSRPSCAGKAARRAVASRAPAQTRPLRADASPTTLRSGSRCSPMGRPPSRCAVFRTTLRWTFGSTTRAPRSSRRP